MTKIRIGYACLFGLALIIPWARSWALDHTRWTPLAIPYPLQPTRLAPGEFTIEASGAYQVVLKITRPPIGTDRLRAERLIGFDPGNPKWGQSARGSACEVAAVIDLTWNLIPLDGRPSEAGVLQGIEDSGSFSRTAGSSKSPCLTPSNERSCLGLVSPFVKSMHKKGTFRSPCLLSPLALDGVIGDTPLLGPHPPPQRV